MILAELNMLLPVLDIVGMTYRMLTDHRKSLFQNANHCCLLLITALLKPIKTCFVTEVKGIGEQFK